MKLDRRTFLLGAAAALVPWHLFDDAPTVEVVQGTLVGTRENGLRVFRGVPFAQPPVGPLRFRAPLSAAPWVGKRDATKNAPKAPQGKDEGDEDCLYLNVWAPAEKGSYPVLIWIHGGGNVGGGTAGQSGAAFARDGIVTVIVPYRLGVFGFLELGDLLGPDYKGSGDNGIRDLQAVLQWAQVNIEAFGGDPKRVTIAGQSAGGKDVGALMAAPSARGLFSRAVMQSGGGQAVHTHASAQVIEAIVGQNKSDIQRLPYMSVPELLAIGHRIEEQYQGMWPFRVYVGGSFLPKRPVDLVTGSVPLLVGTCRDESIAFMNPADAGKPIRAKELTNAPISRISPVEAAYLKAFPTMSEHDRRVRLITAEEYWVPSIRFAEAHARRKGETWMYRFDHAGASGFAAHGAEMEYVWNHRPGWNVHETWVAFIKGSAPAWPKYGPGHRSTLIYGQGGSESVVSDPSSNERRLWDTVL